jgi:uncharacterized protein
MKDLKLEPIIYKIEDNNVSLDKFEKQIRQTKNKKIQDVILDYPTVYIHNWKNADDYEVYIGESNNVVQRSKQHYAYARREENWQNSLLKNNAILYIIGHEHFNKSLTLDIENRLMLYMLSVARIKKIHNQKCNPQNKYYTENELDNIFRQVWSKLRRRDPLLFPTESSIKDSAVYKASPLHKLTPEQESAKESIIRKVFESLDNKTEKQLIFIEGEAGTGKTVLNSSTFYELFEKAEEQEISSIQCCLMVNHDEQITVYEQIAQKLGLTDRYGEVVYKPTRFINTHTVENPIDVAFIDEAHLLLTQGKQSYKGVNQLQDIIDRAKVTVVMFDENQILTTEQFWEAEMLEKYRSMAIRAGNYIELKNQLRIDADKETIEWIDEFTKNQKLNRIPHDTKGYEIKVFDNPEDLDLEIERKANNEKTTLSRLVATYDWEYSTKRAPEDRLKKYWEVLIGKWHKPWNYELEKELNRNEKRNIKSLSWAEQPQTIKEVGSTFTIQGFDLNYVGVILGPSVKYKNGKIIIDPEESFNHKAIRNRTLLDGTKKKFGELLIQNEVRVLMTRGVKGLYIYACDDNLRSALLEMSNNHSANQ